MKKETFALGEPLTLEQLREMDGRCVKVVVDGVEPLEMLALIEASRDEDCVLLRNNLGGVSEFYSDDDLKEGGIKVYAYPPAHINLNYICGEWQGEADGYADGNLVYEYWRCGNCGHLEEEDDVDLLPDFCPDCGLAMTEKAREILKKRLRG